MRHWWWCGYWTSCCWLASTGKLSPIRQLERYLGKQRIVLARHPSLRPNLAHLNAPVRPLRALMVRKISVQPL
ncbi:hypothetical protein EMIT0194P_30435 [Pseudomonas serbica]